jgi:hypothetical protein
MTMFGPKNDDVRTVRMGRQRGSDELVLTGQSGPATATVWPLSVTSCCSASSSDESERPGAGTWGDPEHDIAAKCSRWEQMVEEGRDDQARVPRRW